MYSHRSEYSDRRPHSDRSSRQWDSVCDRVEGSDRSYKNDRNHRYDGDGHSRTERTSRSREYSNSPKRTYSNDSLNRDWNRKSPVGRRVASPDMRSSETKRRRFDKNYDHDYRYRHDPEDETYRQSPGGFSHINVSKDFKHTLPQKEDARHKKTPKDSRHRHLDKEFMYRKQHDNYRPASPYHKERDRYERSWDCSQERTRSQECSTESHTKPTERNDGPYDGYEDQCHNRTRFLLNESSEQSLNSDAPNLQSPTVPGQKPTRGFQRFLDVLNKGVNVETLTRIVTQTSAVAADPPCSPVSFKNSAEGLQSPVTTGRQQGSHQSNSCWSQPEGAQRLASPQAHRSLNPQMSSQSIQRSEGEQSCLISNCRSKSPSVVEKIALTCEDEHRHRQMQGVLQAIGMDLGFDELGQMSHRIQERLYGKKSDDWGHDNRGSKERDTRTSSPSRQSRSSSSRSNVSPLTRDYLMKKDCYNAESEITDHIQLHQAGEFVQNSSSSSLQDNKKCENHCDESSAASEAFSPNPAYTVSETPVTPMAPTYSPYPPMTAVPPALRNLPPHLPHAAPRLFLPYPHIPSLNIFPAVLAPTRHLLPQQTCNTQSPLFNLPDVNPAQTLNATQKSKTLSRPRCLQVIETKQPG